MSDTQDKSPKEQAPEEKAEAPALVVNGQYIKDFSFESPNAPGILSDMQGHQPDINVNVNVSASKINVSVPGNLHEVVLEIQAELKLDGKVGFIAELKYAGVFTLNVPAEHEKPVTLIECPRILFPFARQILSEATQSGGFMPLMLQPIDFASMYQAGLGNLQAGEDDAVN